MSEQVTWGLLASIKKKLKGVQNSVDNIDFTPVTDAVDEVQETLEKVPAGCPAPWLESISAASQEDGIKLTYKARFLQGRINSTENWLFAQTKGVMVRYSSENYPMNRNEGTLAFIDEDLFKVDESGIATAKEKTYTLVGLTTNTKYYISAFPYSTFNVYNETLNQNNGSNDNLNNTTFCTWVGTAATLSVTIMQDLDIFELGEISVTLTPTTGGDALTQSRTGPGDVIFSGLTSGKYIISFSAAMNFTTPVSQEIEILAGVPNNKTVQYMLKTNLSDYTWGQIIDFSESGIANQLFNINDTKKLPLSGHYNYEITMEIVGFNHDELASGGKAGITFGSKNCMNETERMNSRANNYFAETELFEKLNSEIFNSFPEEVRSGIKIVKKKSSEVNSEYGNNRISTDEMKVFLFSDSELGVENPNVADQGACYKKFVNDESRKKASEKSPQSYQTYWTRSFEIDKSYTFCTIDAYGKKSNEVVDANIGVSFGFCV